MISVMNERDIDRKSAAADDLPFFEHPTGKEVGVSGGGRGRDPPGGSSKVKTRFSSKLVSADRVSGVAARVSGAGSDDGDGGFAVRNAEELRPAPSSSPEETRVSPDSGGRVVEMKVEGAGEASDAGVSLDSGGLEARMGDDVAFAAEPWRRSDSSDGTRVSDAVDVKEEVKAGSFPSERLAAVIAVSDDGSDSSLEVIEKPEQTRVSTWDSSLSEASDTSEARHRWMNGLEVGDMVWGKVKSHPWWPGHIFNESFASLSVRRTKREGHVLVAFFGDSSYGWFDQAELIPFDVHYAEKSKQTTSRNFVKAVEEAVDEASRRQAMGLSCRCRNPSNFQPLSVPGYFAVDVEGYEPGGVYSAKQIKMVRDSFVPIEALSFVNQLALAPREPEVGSFDWIKKTAMLLALRKALFEEFDETYAEAFGVQPVRPTRDAHGMLDQPGRAPPRVAPLSGPLVIAEALGERRISHSAKSVVRSPRKEHASSSSSKKNKYLFKRREEPVATSTARSSLLSTTTTTGQKPQPAPKISTRPPPPQPLSDSHFAAQDRGNLHYFTLPQGPPAPQNVHYVPHGQANVIITSPPLFKEAAVGCSLAASEAGNYVLQKRAPTDTEKQQKIPANECDGKIFGPGGGVLLPEMGGQMTGPSGMSSAESPGTRIVADFQTSYVPSRCAVPEDIFRGTDAGRLNKIDEDSSRRTNEGSASVRDGDVVILRQEDKTVIGAKEEIGSELKRGIPPQAEGQIEGVGSSITSPVTTVVPMNFEMLPRKTYVTEDVGRLVKKEKVHKRPREEHDAEEKKKKRKKKEVALEAGVEHPLLKHAKIKKDGELLRKPAAKSVGVQLAHVDNAEAELQAKVDGGEQTRSTSDSVIQLPRLDLAALNLGLPDLISDLAALALDPFYGVDRNASTIALHVFLRFRSLVYQKSLVLPPDGELDSSEPHPSKYAISGSQPETHVRTTEFVYIGETQDRREHAKPMKSAQKPTLKPDDPTKMGRKRMPSDRQEEKSAKRLKKLNQLKALTSEKKPGVVQKAPDAQQRGEQDSGGTRPGPAKPMKADAVKKQEPPPPPKAAVPTYLVMRFPIRTTLPSIPSLKARFARFGPLDPAETRVFWKSCTCKVLFKYKSDAQAAYTYARNNDMFGQIKVSYNLREVEDAVPEPPAEAFQSRMRNGGNSIGDRRTSMLQQQQQSGQLKSILKKPSGDETAATGMGSAVKETPRVKFMLGGDDGRSELAVVVSIGNGGGGGGGNGADGTSSSVGQFEVNSKTPPKSVSFPSTLSSLLPRPAPHLPSPPSRLPPPADARVQFVRPQTQPSQRDEMWERESGGVDISRQMLNLLMRCSDVVANVKCTLGYVPYHPL